MKALKIDPFKEKITELELGPSGGNLKTYQDLVGGMIASVYIPADAIVYVNDEGLYAEGQRFFLIHGLHQPLAGVGVVIGSDGEGDADCPISLSKMESAVVWGNAGLLMSMAPLFHDTEIWDSVSS